jgi:hypothetical protein
MLSSKVAIDFAWYKSILTYFADDYTIGRVENQDPEEVIGGLEMEYITSPVLLALVDI